MGLYSSVSYAVARRTREIGIRLAVGAKPATVVRQLIFQSMTVAGAGLVAGAVIGPLAGELYRLPGQRPFSLRRSYFRVCRCTPWNGRAVCSGNPRAAGCTNRSPNSLEIGVTYAN